METEYIWLTAGVILVILEFLLPMVGCLFAGLAALIVGLALTSGLISSGNSQLVTFFIFTIAFAAILWKPLKNFGKGKGVVYNDMVGQKAILLTDLEGEKIGQAKWSGTNMKAKLEDGAQPLKKGHEAEIMRVDGNVLVLK